LTETKNPELDYTLRDDGVQYHFKDEGISIYIRPKSAQKQSVVLAKDKVYVQNTGDIDSKAFRERLVVDAETKWKTSTNGLKDYLELIAIDLPTRLVKRQEAAEKHHKENAPPELQGTPYQIHNGGFVRFKSVGGMEVLEPLTNFTAVIEEQSIKDDGAEAKRWYRITGKAGEKTLPAVVVPASNFAVMNWVADAWGVDARIEAGPLIKDHTRAAIEALSVNAPVRHLFQHTGWRVLPDGRRVFLIGGGAVDHGDVEVELEEGLTRYQLPRDISEMGSVMGQSRVVELVDVGPHRVTMPLVGATYLAPLSEVIVPDFVIWLWAATGNLKSTLAALVLSHFGWFDEKCLPLSFESTANALERSLFLAKDVPIVVDDFRPAISKGDAAQQDVKAQRLLRSVGNRQGRSRMNSDTTLRKSYPPRGVVIATGETIPDGPAFESAVSRSLTISLLKQDVDLELLTELQGDRMGLQASMVGYLRWLAADWDKAVETAKEVYTKYAAEFRNTLGAEAHPRLPGTLAALYTGLWMFSEYAEAAIAAQPDYRRKGVFLFEAMQSLYEAAREHMDATKGGDPASRFLEILGSMFAGRQAFAKSKVSDAAPEDERECEILNWRVDPYNGDNIPVTGARFVGWADKDFLYLHKHNAYAAVSEFAQRGGIPFGISPKALWHSMAVSGHSISGSQRSDTTIRISGVVKRVVQVPRVKVFGDDEALRIK
jgi:hypothetical protein